MKINLISFILVYSVVLGVAIGDGNSRNFVVQRPPPRIHVLRRSADNKTTDESVSVSNSTTSAVVPIQPPTKGKTVPRKQAPVNTTTTALPTKSPAPTNNSKQIDVKIPTEGGPLVNVTSSTSANVSSSSLSPSSANSTSKTIAVSTTATPTTKSTTTTTTKSTTTATTTTPKPLKPKLTVSSEDEPDNLSNEKATGEKNNTPVTNAHEVEEPHVQPSQEQSFNAHRDFVVPLVTFIFALPIFLGIAVIGYRKVRDYWSTRHYRRMDFLVDGMYND